MTTRTQSSGRLEHFLPIRKSDLERVLTQDPMIGRDGKGKLIKFIDDEDRFRATSVDQALVRLDKNWDELFPFFNEHARREQDKRQRPDTTN